MAEKTYIVATIKQWNIDAFNNEITKFPGDWHLITDKDELSFDNVKKINPDYIFFPHWNHIVTEDILNLSKCICFHETDLPYGRGGSPIQNLIVRGHNSTFISAIKMVSKLDAGPVYYKRKLSLEGTAGQIYRRASSIIAGLIFDIITFNPVAKNQIGDPVIFKRRTPDQSEVTKSIKTKKDFYNHIRMLDADTYPRAFFNMFEFRFELSKPILKEDSLIAEVKITNNFDSMEQND